MTEEFVWDKDEWRRNAFSMIKESLYFAKDTRLSGNYYSAHEDHLVMIYGDTQVGKTTLILNMIGIREDCFQQVYDTLRAGVPKGNSSTSTAIIYSRSEKNQYGCMMRPMNSSDDMMEYFESADLIVERLQQIRGSVEKGKVNTNNILYIAIPNQYFEEDAKNSNISIIDMPGDNSKNQEEAVHVANLLTKYIPIASTCIIACKDGEIQSLETLELPNKINWRNMSHRFVLVVTRAYSDSDTKSYFLKHEIKAEGEFYEYVQENYTTEIRTILGGDNKTEIYPIDLGESLNMLRSEVGGSESNLTAINYARSATLKNLRQSIVNHEGERLHSALEDLRVVINENSKIRLVDINDEISKNEHEIEKLKREEDNLKTQIESYELLISQKSDELAPYAERKSILDKSAIAHLGVNGIWKSIDNHIRENEWYCHPDRPDSTYIKGVGLGREEVYRYIHETLSFRVKEIIDRCNKRKEYADYKIDINTINDIINDYFNEVYVGVFHLDRPVIQYTRKRRVTPDDLKEIVCNIAQKVDDYLLKSKNEIVEKLNSTIRVKENSISQYSVMIKNAQAQLRKKQLKSQECCDKIQLLRQQEDEAKRLESEDVNTLEQYINFARAAYLQYREKIIGCINSFEVSAEEKLKLTLYLGILDKDYLKVIGG